MYKNREYNFFHKNKMKTRIKKIEFNIKASEATQTQFSLKNKVQINFQHF